MTRRDPYWWTVVRLPERDLAALVLELAAPLLERLGPAPAIDEARTVVALAVTFWNASVLASKRWEYPRVQQLEPFLPRPRPNGEGRQQIVTWSRLRIRHQVAAAAVRLRRRDGASGAKQSRGERRERGGDRAGCGALGGRVLHGLRARQNDAC
jgi:hypothetical protein